MISFSAGYVFHSSPNCLSYLRNKNSFDLPISHFSPLHCGLHEQANASFPSSNKQEPPLRHPAIRQPWGKCMFIRYFGKLKWYTSFSIDFSQLYIPERRCFSHSFSSREGRRTSYRFLPVARLTPQHFSRHNANLMLNIEIPLINCQLCVPLFLTFIVVCTLYFS